MYGVLTSQYLDMNTKIFVFSVGLFPFVLYYLVVVPRLFLCYKIYLFRLVYSIIITLSTFMLITTKQQLSYFFSDHVLTEKKDRNSYGSTATFIPQQLY